MSYFKEYMDYVIGGSLFLTAPMMSQVLFIPHSEGINDGLTLTIQALSVVLLLMRIRSQYKKNAED